MRRSSRSIPMPSVKSELALCPSKESSKSFTKDSSKCSTPPIKSPRNAQDVIDELYSTLSQKYSSIEQQYGLDIYKDTTLAVPSLDSENTTALATDLLICLESVVRMLSKHRRWSSPSSASSSRKPSVELSEPAILQMKDQRSIQHAFEIIRRRKSLDGGMPLRIANYAPNDSCEASHESSVASLTFKKSVVMNSNAIREEDGVGFEMINNYIVVDEIGEGAQGQVYLVVDSTTDTQRAMKVIKREREFLSPSVSTSMSAPISDENKSSENSPAFLNHQHEVAILKKLRHHNIVSLLEVIDDPNEMKVFLILEYVEGGSIARNMDKTKLTCDAVPPLQLAFFLRDVLNGLSYLHRHGILHRDIKPENILVDEVSRNGGIQKIAKLVDFGVSEAVYKPNESGEKDKGGLQTKRLTVGTPPFMAPELWTNDENAIVDGSSADIWSVGVTMYMLFFGVHPFAGKLQNLKTVQEVRQFLTSVKPDDITWPMETVISTELEAAYPKIGEHWKNCLQSMIEWNMTKRISLNSLRKHPLFNIIRKRSILSVLSPPTLMTNAFSEEDDGNNSPMIPVSKPSPEALSKTATYKPQDEMLEQLVMILPPPGENILQMHFGPGVAGKREPDGALSRSNSFYSTVRSRIPKGEVLEISSAELTSALTKSCVSKYCRLSDDNDLHETGSVAGEVSNFQSLENTMNDLKAKK